MKNFKKIALSLLVVGVALAGSAFTNAKVIGERWVQTSPGVYEKITATYQAGLCETASNACSYVLNTSATYSSPLSLSFINSTNASAPGTFTPQQTGEYTGDLNP